MHRIEIFLYGLFSCPIFKFTRLCPVIHKTIRIVSLLTGDQRVGLKVGNRPNPFFSFYKNRNSVRWATLSRGFLFVPATCGYICFEKKYTTIDNYFLNKHFPLANHQLL